MTVSKVDLSSNDSCFVSIDEKKHAWWREADFGFVKKVQDSLVTVCEPEHEVLLK